VWFATHGGAGGYGRDAMSLKHAVLALIAERRGYGYELAQRFEERVGPGWQLNPSAVYPALDQLERSGLATGAARRGGTRRSPRVVYAPTAAGTAALETWHRTTAATPEPVRAELHLRLAFAGPEHAAFTAARLAAQQRACSELLARCEDGRARSHPDASGASGRALVDDAVSARLRAEVAWLTRARAAVESDGG
jgi:DNA-binding PadR family transcriptional regulator